MNVLALDLGGTKLAAALFDLNGNIVRRESIAVEGRGGDAAGDIIIDVVRGFRTSASVAAVGVAVPGIYRSATGTVWAPNISGWDDYPLLSKLKAELGPYVPCAIESDRSCYILGEVWRGNARGAQNAIFIAVGTGIGAGILCDGRVLRGHHDIAGAVGWLALERPFEEKYRECGNFEYYASGPGLVRAAAEHGKHGLTTADVFAAYGKDESWARDVMTRATSYWGMAVANLVGIFNPEIVVFGGGVFGPAVPLIEKIYDEALQWAQPISIRQVKLVATALGNDAGLYGAAQVALAQLPTSARVLEA